MALPFSSLLERSSSILVKLGMPLVYGYHLICGSVFLNVAADDASNLEKLANNALAPLHYLFEGKRAIPVEKDGVLAYDFVRRFDYSHHFFVKTAASLSALPISLTVGIPLKALACMTNKEHYQHLVAADKSTHVVSNVDYYRSLGLEINDFEKADLISPPKHKRRLEDLQALKGDVEALKEIVAIMKEEKIPFWIDCGSCLGAYRYGGVIPWDWDIDMAVLSPDFNNVKHALHRLDSEKYVVQDWSGRDRPETYLKVYVKETQNLIDIYHFGFDPVRQELFTILSNEFNIFLPESWKIRELRYTTPMPFSHVFPLKKALFEGIEVPVPGHIEEYLQTFYGQNLEPIRIYNEISGEYEKDDSHPYWQLPYVH